MPEDLFEEKHGFSCVHSFSDSPRCASLENRADILISRVFEHKVATELRSFGDEGKARYREAT